MNDEITSEQILLRTLGNYRSSDPFIYTCLRLLISQTKECLPFYKELPLILKQKMGAGQEWNFRNFPQTKAISSTGPEIRTMVSPSPLSSMAEAYLLANISSSEAFINQQTTYSYLWPNSTAPASFQYYFPLYRKRDRAVLSGLQNNQGTYALVLDVKKFYPSCKKDIVLKKIQDAFKDNSSSNLRSTLLAFSTSLLNSSPEGIPIGPAFGHFLGNVYLHNFDEDMVLDYHDRYFRYVDDMVFIVQRDQIEATKKKVSDSLESLGLALNQDKSDVLDLGQWKSWVEFCENRDESISFEDCISAIAFKTAFSNNSTLSIEEEILCRGLLLPIQRIRSLASNPRFQMFGVFRLLRDRFRGYRRSKITAVLKTGILQSLFCVKDSLLFEINKTRESLKKPNSPTQRRWLSQRLRYSTSRLLYLLPFNELPELLKFSAEFEELTEITALVRSLISKDFSPLLNYPGRLPSAYSELYKSLRIPPQKVTISSNLTLEQCESLTTLILRGVAEPIYKSSYPIESKEYGLRLVSGNSLYEAVPRHQLGNYWNEVEWLFHGITSKDLDNVFSQRWSYYERPQLDCATLGLIGYYL